MHGPSKTSFDRDRMTIRKPTITSQLLELSQLFGESIFVIFQVILTIIECIYRKVVPVTPTSVKGDIVLISGTGHGIGKELAFAYAAEGATVVGWDINADNNEQTINEINSRGYPKAYAYVCDVSIKERVMEVAKKVQDEVGDVTILINNAGIMPTHPILEQTQLEIENQFKINVFAHFWTIQAFLPAMLKNNRGHIVSISSIAGLVGLVNLVPYCGTKFAVSGYMEALREELRRTIKNCKVETTTICPYMVDTGLCKRPKIKFGSLMALLEPKLVAKEIMSAQRTGQKIITIPRYLLPSVNLMRCLPVKAAIFFKDFIEAGVESDL